jgi:hypothetical protein
MPKSIANARHRRHWMVALLSLSLLGSAWAQTPETVRIRGQITAVNDQAITVKTRSGEVVELALGPQAVVMEVYPIQLSDIKPGHFIGTAAMPQSDGTQKAIAVTVFPESARGMGEGHRPYDLQPSSTMTNATVADVVGLSNGRTLQLKYKDGQKTLVVPADAPVVSFKPAERDLLVVGASVSIFAQLVSGQATATRINAGRNGFALPY